MLLRSISLLSQNYFYFLLLFIIEPCVYTYSYMDLLLRLANNKASSSFGRILTWNVKKLGSCLQQENVEQLKEVICVILQSANLIVLQEASNLDFSCLPCSTALKDDYVWRAEGGMSEDFKILVKTKMKKSIR